MAKFIFINGKERKFKKIKMRELTEFEKNLQEEIAKAKDQDDIIRAVGVMASGLLIDFDPEEMFDAEQDEFMLAQALHILAPYYKGGRTASQIQAVKDDIIDATTIANINRIRMGNFQQ